MFMVSIGRFQGVCLGALRGEHSLKVGRSAHTVRAQCKDSPPSSEAWTARSEVLKRGAPRQPIKQKSNNAPHSPQNNPNKQQ